MAEIFGATTSTAANADSLFAGAFPATQIPGTILSGQNIVRGQILGRVDLGAATIAAGTNTGGGTCTGAVTLGVNAKVGVYTAKCVETASNGGTFIVTSPTGERLPDAVVGTVYSSTDISGFTINDVGTDFAVGDTFTITIAAGSGKWKAYSAAGIVGENVPRGILVADADATSGDVLTSIYTKGEFNRAKLTGATTAVENKLQEFGIIVRGVS